MLRGVVVDVGRVCTVRHGSEAPDRLLHASSAEDHRDTRDTDAKREGNDGEINEPDRVTAPVTKPCARSSVSADRVKEAEVGGDVLVTYGRSDEERAGAKPA